MKLIINKCYGGFGINTETMKKLVMAGDPAIRKMSVQEYSGRKNFQEDLTDIGDRFYTDPLELCAIKDGTVYTPDYESLRTSEILIGMIEAGVNVNTPVSKLEVVSIPDNVDWVIEAEDGLEHVAEVHRTWS